MTFSVLELTGLIAAVAVTTTLVILLLVLFWPERTPPDETPRKSTDDRIPVNGVITSQVPSDSYCGDISNAGVTSDSSSSSGGCD